MSASQVAQKCSRLTSEATGKQHTPQSGNLMLLVRVGRPVKPHVCPRLVRNSKRAIRATVDNFNSARFCCAQRLDRRATRRNLREEFGSFLVHLKVPIQSALILPLRPPIGPHFWHYNEQKSKRCQEKASSRRRDVLHEVQRDVDGRISWHPRISAGISWIAAQTAFTPKRNSSRTHATRSVCSRKIVAMNSHFWSVAYPGASGLQYSPSTNRRKRHCTPQAGLLTSTAQGRCTHPAPKTLHI